ncbi:hypothetical protein PHYPO_G00193700 [Pangasianodon hypophthalmus]|uniref:SAM domain-containing protein n=1 Tax=Pangasianodon hypophthalmus TaxID=310915 RepID=A0A5N5PJB5_PANHP|nr:hypothetical protein PHYPO_G00193700 [Pangasianodon hypophthalmus]
MDRGSALASFIKSTLPKLTELEPLLEVLQELGVQDLEDLNYIQERDLLHVLKPVEVRRILSHFKTTSQRDVRQSSQKPAVLRYSPQTQPDKMSLSA